MQEEMDEILKRIEDLRKRLQELSQAKGVANQEVITASQMLDAVLNEYYEIFKGRKGE